MLENVTLCSQSAHYCCKSLSIKDLFVMTVCLPRRRCRRSGHKGRKQMQYRKVIALNRTVNAEVELGATVAEVSADRSQCTCAHSTHDDELHSAELDELALRVAFSVGSCRDPSGAATTGSRA